MTTTYPNGRTSEQQFEINEHAVAVCGTHAYTCQTEMGYVHIGPGPTQAEAALEGNIIAGVIVVLGLLWLAAKVWAAAFGAKRAVRYIID